MEHGLAQMAGYRPKYRMAYTINNKQPVTCSLIGTDPLYYMDIDRADHVDGHAFCEVCCKVREFHSEPIEEPFLPEGFSHGDEFVCNHCEIPIASFYVEDL